MRVFSSLFSLFSVLMALGQASCDGYLATFSNTTGPGNVAVFFNTIQPLPNGSSWEFGDGSSGTGSQVAHTYTSSGTYTVCYTAWWWNENIQDTCWSTTCESVVVGGANPCDGLHAGFSFAASGGGFQFSNATTGTGATTTWYWVFDDGTTSTEPQPFHEFPAAGVYEVCLTAISVYIDDNGGALTCADTTCESVTVQGGNLCDGFQACFVTNDFGGGAFFFDNCSSTQGNAQFVWNFGDGGSSTGVNVDHVYQEPGTYTVCLTAYEGNCVDSTCTVVVVEGGGEPCDGFNADFSWGSNGGDPSSIFYSATTSNASHWLWSFGDGTYSDNGPQGTHTYAEPGVYELCLKAYFLIPGTEDTCFATSCQLVTIGEGNPCDGLNAGFGFSTAGLSVNFDNAVINNEWSYYWSFGDGTTGYGPNPAHTYASSGQYHACLTVWTWNPVTQDTCFADHCSWVTVQGGNPCEGFAATISWDLVGSNTYVFAGTTSIPASGMIWDFGDGTEGFGATVTHIYPAPGEYHVCLSAWYWNQQTQDSCWAEACVWINVGGGNPCDELHACFEASPVGNNGFQFTNCTVPQSGVQFVWHFGDGTTGSETSPDHNYPGPGSYVVCLIASWGACMDSTCTTVVVEGGAPCDTFNATISWNAAGGNTAVFAGSTNFPANGLIWYFGDGAEGVGPTVTHTYAEPGEYHVCLMAWHWIEQTQDTCWTETCLWINVGNGNPCEGLNAGFSFAPTGLAVNFQNAVINPQWTYLWSFGDGTSGYGPNPAHTYTSSGQYHACLTVWTWNPVTQDTCFADHCEWVTVQGVDPCDQFHACFVTNDMGDGTFFFDNCSTEQGGADFLWFFGDGTTSDDTNVEHTFSGPGTYSVCLIAMWDNCTDSVCTTVTVGSGTPCDAGFTADFEWTAQGNAVVFHGTSNLPANGLLWFFGDGTNGAGEVITHLYEPPGPYNVCLAAWYWNQQTQDTCWAEHCELVDPFDTGIQDNPLGSIHIFPQPASDVITIDGIPTAATLRLFASDGRLVLSDRSTGPLHRIDVTGLATGVYVLHLDMEGSPLRYRIVVE
ncbi:MAG: PKD domain-containing protein [Flavobacteriales bacterium]